MAFQGLGEPRALELANPSQALLSPLPSPPSLPKLRANSDPAHHGETKAAGQEIRDITSAPPPRPIFPLVYSPSFLKEYF